MKKIKIGVLIYTYNRFDDAKINMEIIRNVWQKKELFKETVIVHTFNGEKKWWPKKYLEDKLLYLNNPGHFKGAEILINEGIKTFKNLYPNIDYVIILASDTWCVNPEYVEKVIKTMQEKKQYFATCAWGTKKESNMFKIGMAIDFCIVDIKWSVKFGLFPLKFTDFVDKYSEYFFYHDQLIFLERVVALRFKQAISKSFNIPSDNLLKKITQEHIYHMVEREPIHIFSKKSSEKNKQCRKMYWSSLGLITHHDPIKKKEILCKTNLILGDYGKKLINTDDLSYYNQGLTKTYYLKNGKKIYSID